MQFREYAAVLRQYWWILALTAIAAATSAIVFARAQTPVYRSSVRLEVTGRIDNGQVLAIEKTLRQTAARIGTTAVAEGVEARISSGLGTGQIKNMIHASAVPEMLHVQLDVDDTDQARAPRIAQAAAAVAQELEVARMSAALPEERISLRPIDSPSPARLIWPQTGATVLAAGLVGLVAGALIAFGLAYVDDTLKSPEDVERLLRLPTIGVLPRWGGTNSLDAQSQSAPPHRSLWTRLRPGP